MNEYRLNEREILSVDWVGIFVFTKKYDLKNIFCPFLRIYKWNVISSEKSLGDVSKKYREDERIWKNELKGQDQWWT